MHINNDPFSIHNGNRCSYQIQIVDVIYVDDETKYEDEYYIVHGKVKHGSGLPAKIKIPGNVCIQQIFPGDELWMELKVQPDYSILCKKVNL